jgi:GNAT superfamily N-acetyltransferase
MNDFYVSPARPEDKVRLRRLWSTVFGDPDELIDSFLALLPGAGYGLVCRDSENIASMAYVLDGISISGEKAAYIYAVATAAEFRGRGLGAELMLACRETAAGRGCRILCTSPAEPSLYEWYGGILGMSPASFVRRQYVLPGPASDAGVFPLSPGDYNSIREKYLSDAPHAVFTDAYVALSEAVCRASGGGLFKTGSGAAACYPEDGLLMVRELLCAPCDIDFCVSALCRKFGCGGAEVRTFGRDAPVIAAAADCPLPEGLWWGLELD